MVRDGRRAGVPVLVLDPSPTPWPDATFSTRDTDEFIRVVFANTRCLLIIDEAGEAIGRAMSADHAPRNKLATRTRHLGHSAIFISQDATTISPVIRRQCQRAWLFRQGHTSAKILREQMANEGIMAATQLRKGKCLYADLYGEVYEFDVFTVDGKGDFVNNARAKIST